MGASKKKQIVNSHVKNYVQAIWANRLREEGFISVEDRDISWIRIKNGEIINTITFFSQWNNLPLLLSVGYGIHPLFIDPFYSRSAYLYNRPYNKETFYEQDLGSPQAQFSQDIAVYAPSEGGRGIEVFNDIILPKMEGIHTFEECYAVHKEDYLKPGLNGKRVEYPQVSFEFIDEVIYAGDTEMYDICKVLLNECIDATIKNIERFPDKKVFKEWLDEEVVRKHAFSSGDARLEYIATLEQKKKKNLAMLHKKFGI